MKLLFIGYLIGLATAGLGLFIEEVLDKRRQDKQRRLNSERGYVDYRIIKNIRKRA
jgi:hypothetical protein